MANFKAGKINKHILHSHILERDVTLSVYLPENYSELFKYQVIICFDGLDFLRFGRIQREYERLRREEQIQRAIIVGFHYEDVDKRREEFHPQGSRSSKTVQAVGKELLPFIDNTFPTYKVGNARILMGDSLAGSIALLTALTYPTIFSQVAMLSPHSDSTVLDKLDHCMQFKELTIWHAIGKEEADFKLPTTGERANFLTPNRALSKAIQQCGITYQYTEFDGGHNWKSWKPMLADILNYFLNEEIPLPSNEV
ncbi:esterase family protein [Staphylococcus sp. NRL 16/872]|uniref:esterase family protein n=1 Tax=Staphylococcus sp. NRL 16/872 TaxID=2930131 RepID=UPI001FB20239|nr:MULTISPECIES: esterase family protein [unclassified Staphylococcus]MCJ1656746.1 esterase family protein [Staphylococcus sp. NRL 21/187]MCJ1662498.1 esterase family protein [Staphylococcus sp. NRL 18/288]MCJ1668592.1 esterase family protein [Staphylococcus sp. NRL 19/737]WEN68809.1 esterase family protein [Staphylococcus sp. NRL 16/872]